MLKKAFLLITMFLMITFCFSSVYAQTLYEQKSTETVSQGVTRENIKRFLDNGWLNINILRIDLTDPYINVDTIFSKDGSCHRTPILQMTKDNGAISAVNGDFFAPQPGTNLAHSMSPMVQNGQLITTYEEEQSKNNFGVFGLTKRNFPIYTFWSKSMTIIAPNGQTTGILDLNKFGWYEFLYVYDKNWGDKTPGKTDKFPTLTEMTVVNNKVQSFNYSSSSVPIPENGYVVSGDFGAGEFLKNNFKVGDTVKINYKTTPSWNLFKMVIGGGAILLKNGQIPNTFSHEKPDAGPQTVVATTKDNKQMLLVTVDGRQVSSKGMTQPELANFLLSIGAYNALNLDGGGSTTMVSKDLGEEDLRIINSYSDPSPRGVVNGIGVFSNAPAGVLKGLKIINPDVNTFVNSSRKYSVIGYDTYSNPIDVDQSKIQWSFEGISGKFTDGYFSPSSIGKGKIIAEVDGVTVATDINVLSSPVEIEVYPKAFAISNTPQWFGIRGYDKDGYMAFIYSRDAVIACNDIATVTDNFLKTKNSQSGIGKVSFGGVYTYFSVGSKNTVLDDFESSGNSFWSYPSSVTGNYSIASNHYEDGTHSGKLEFDFTGGEGSRAAYIKFGQDGYSIPSNPAKVTICVYTSQKYSHSIKAEFTDVNGQVFRTTFSSSIDWTAWKQLETTIPDGTAFPIKLKKVYVVETNSNIKDSGELYFDSLQLIYNTSSVTLPPSKTIKDYQNVTSVPVGENSFRFNVYGSTDKLSVMSKYNINNRSSLAGFVGSFPSNILDGIKTSSIQTKGFKITDYKNSKFISLIAKGADNDNSIRRRDPNQWLSLFDTLKNNTKDNIFLLLDCPLSGDYGFCDGYELQLFKDTLTKYVEQNHKNIWVLYSNDTQTVKNENGVKYIGVPNSSAKQYLSIVVKDNKVTYKFNKLF